ncbi:HAAS domain-containing protein [Priestia taiwanensis]|uniref:NADH dehydrogenase n=1 Tax=Priestia taiwanensis TaxID=1347902 RepID=A0A917ARJ8_9BACI|nr:hypothetical protein [Priestia taiwanensis]MBM7363893.1 hypothetical protein [Priestia taiwanensis]GGE69902.1 NADH dehydrogenase [Priestia taiwanensis]
MKLSKEGELFICDLSGYLLTKGVSDKQRLEFIEEAEAHLLEAEANGKTVQDVFGEHPKQYADELSREMNVEKGWIYYLPLVFFSFVAYTLMTPAIRGELSFSLLGIIGYPVIFVVNSILLIIGVRTSSFRSKWKGFAILYLFLFVTCITTLIVALVDRFIMEPIIVVDGAYRWLVVASCLLFFTLVAWKEKSWIWIGVPLILTGPKIILEVIGIQGEASLLIESVTTFGLLAILFLYDSKRSPKEVSNA